MIAVLVSVGATFGGSLVFEYGFNVETAGDHPVWHRSETDVFPGAHHEEEGAPVTKLQQLFVEQGQSPWLDNLTRSYLRDGTLARFVEDGIRGVTANPTIFARAIEGSDAYDEQFAALIAAGALGRRERTGTW